LHLYVFVDLCDFFVRGPRSSCLGLNAASNNRYALPCMLADALQKATCLVCCTLVNFVVGRVSVPCGPQASLSVTVLFASYIAQQRFRPFVAVESLSSGLQVGYIRACVPGYIAEYPHAAHARFHPPLPVDPCACVTYCHLVQLSGESLMRQLSAEKAQGSVQHSSTRSIGSSPDAVSTVRCRSQKQDSSSATEAATPPSRADMTSAVAAGQHGPPSVAAPGAHHAVAVVSPGTPWFKQLSVNTLTLTVDYNVRNSGARARDVGPHPPLPLPSVPLRVF
jgi:hypothetical protein